MSRDGKKCGDDGVTVVVVQVRNVRMVVGEEVK